MNIISDPITLIKKSFEIFFKKENFIYFLKIYFPAFIISLLSVWRKSSGMTSELEKGNFQYFLDKPILIALIVLVSLATLIFGIWFSAASLEAVISVVNSGTLAFKDTYKRAWGYALKLALVSFLVGLIVVGGLILLIIPGIVFSVWFAFARFGIAEKKLGIGASLKESKSLVTGRFWEVFGRLFVLSLFAIVGQIVFSFVPFVGPAILTIFGALFLLPHYLLYRELESGSVGKI